MKLNFFPCIIAVLVGALVAFGLYSWCRYVDMNLIIAIVGGVCLALTSGVTLGASFPMPRTTTNIKVVSGIFAFLFVISDVVFCCLTTFSLATYVVTNGLLLIVWLLSIYGIAKANM